ncbi:MAG: ORF 73 extensive acidic domains, potential leucine zipper immediate early protein homolog [uncultured Sulfurovum sp.]|uniref:ORF 73 extensive acidic domains, potential leucine zipper immediate early protein homolog n=1 Tax=uncultured Sulfurovum sp. TaxID=269237 RepID=A0A6S6T910_9BACT|nr:MAG: ORF 73 extensive acidic domains, potential leucine zipper immediate early protein homolog [uncultured Sulfurovum sp.]
MDDNHDDEEIKVQDESITPNKKNKLAEAEALIEASKELVAKVDSDVAECKVGISSAAEAFDTAKKTFNEVTFKNSEALLEKVGFDYTTFEERDAFELAVDSDDDEAFSVKSLNSGRFTGLLLAIFVALLTVMAWIYLAMTKLGIDPNSITTLDNATAQINPILTWIGGDMISANGNMTIGALILGFSALIMAWLVYAIRINFKAKKNLHIAQETFDKTNEYCSTQEACQQEMIKVDSHLREATQEITNLDMILNEQVSILKRIIHVEGIYDHEKDYHPSSKKVMRETEKIMRTAEHLVSTAITQDKKLNFQSVQALNTAKGIYSEYLGRIYD